MTHPEDTATIERDLAAVDAALAGASLADDPRARELQELALALQADAPPAEPAFAEELRGRMEAGFPPAAGSARGRAEAARARQAAALERLAAKARRAPRAALLPVAGVGVSLLLVVVVVFAVGGPPSGDGDSGGSAGGGGVVSNSGGGAEAGGGEAAAVPESLPGEVSAERSAGADSAAKLTAPSPGGGFVPGQRSRKIERSFSLELDVPLKQMTRVADGVTTVTNRHGGFVLDSSVSSGEDGGGGDFSLRIPTDRLRPALRDLAELAPVIRQTQEGRDVTREHVTAKDRLQAARAERRSLLRRLEAAATDEEAEAIRRRLDIVAGEINGLRGLLRDLRLRTDYAVVSVDLAGTEGDSGSGGAGGSFDDALNDAGDLVVGLAGVLIRVLAIALPLALIAGLGWLATSLLRRRRRESVLA